MPDAAKLVLGRNTTGDYALLYSVYSWPNVVLPFIGGWLVDRVSIHFFI